LINHTSGSHFSWRQLCGVAVLAALVVASLFLPPRLEQLRTGHWEVEHFLAYLVAVPILSLGWPRPFLVAIALVPVAALLEALQCLNPDHTPNVFAALSSICGVLAGTLLTILIIRLMSLQSSFKDRETQGSAGS
jgi:VanZ family protein